MRFHPEKGYILTVIKLVISIVLSLIVSIAITLELGILTVSESTDSFHLTVEQMAEYDRFLSVKQKVPVKEPIVLPAPVAPPPFQHIVRAKSERYNIAPALVSAVITVESNWNPKAVSSKGAMGLMQLMPSTAKELNVTRPFDPEENIDGGTKYLRSLLDRFDDDLTLALAAYNAGPRRIIQYKGMPPFAATRKYVKRVLSVYRETKGISNRSTKL